MILRTDPNRRTRLLRRAVKAESDRPEEAAPVEAVRLPVPIDRIARIEHREEHDAHAAFAAQLLGQNGQKRGLKAGAEAIEMARSLYVRTEWSGSHDRRQPKGARTRTEV